MKSGLVRDSILRLTADVEAGAGQDVSFVVVAHQVVAGRLPGGVEAGQRHAEVGWAQHAVQRAGQRLTVERPEQGAGVHAELRVDPAAGGQVGAHAQDRVLGVDQRHVWRTRDSQRTVRGQYGEKPRSRLF